MKYNYDEIINELNEEKIESIIFSIEGYAHYKKCVIQRFVHIDSNNDQIIRIEFKLVEDDSETISFYKKYNDNHKIFKFGRKGSFTFKQIWNKVQILQINYYDNYK